jgi:hypothetical protein
MARKDRELEESLRRAVETLGKTDPAGWSLEELIRVARLYQELAPFLLDHLRTIRRQAWQIAQLQHRLEQRGL